MSVILLSDWLVSKVMRRGGRGKYLDHMFGFIVKPDKCRESDGFIGPIGVYYLANITQSEAKSARVINWSNWSNYCLTSDLTSASDRLQT